MSRTSNVSVEALTVHSRPCNEAWRSLRITGSAVVTTRLSRVAMNRATEVITNVQALRVPSLLVNLCLLLGN
jgi:hypothetical protein